MTLNLGYGIQRLIDAQQRYAANTRGVWLRLRNFTPPQNQLYAQLGYVITPSSGAAGTADIPIDPPPSVRLVSMHSIGMSNGKLRMGARDFTISASFVTAQQQALGLERPEFVFLGRQTVGLYSDNQLFTIEQVAHEEIGGQSVIWTLTCNAPEQLK